MKVLVCGGRDYSDVMRMEQVLSGLTPMPSLIIHGDYRGADRMAKAWALRHGIHHAAVEALWDDYGGAAGPKRNSAMLQLLPHLVVAFPGGKGTRDMIDRAKAVGVRVVVVE